MNLGTALVLIGTILFFLALVLEGRWGGVGFFTVHSLLAIAGVLVGVGVLLGAPALHA